MQVGLASPERIRLWSHGEVKKAETINYRTLKPEPDGLFCERIFGPEKDYECHCGRYKRIRYRGVICERCGVEVTTARVRRERMGHIELAAPVAHVWFLRGIPSRIAMLLDIPLRTLEKVVYFASFIITDAGHTPLAYKQALTPEEHADYRDKHGQAFKAMIGAEAVKELLNQLNLEKLAQELKDEIGRVAGQRRVKAVKRLEIIEAFRKSGNRPEWMITEALPVIPPDLRPLVPLDGGRFATSDLNDLYRRVINRNNRLKKLMEVNAPDIIVRNEKRMLQEAVDALIDNGRRARPIVGAGNRPLRSLSDMLKGKQGRFRQNLLGKRVDYSGRSVIVVGPKLRIDQCGLPKEMALEMFKPFVMKKIVERGFVHNIKSAKRMIERQRPEVWELLEEVIKDHPVLLNRAPTLHRLGIQAFMPILVEGKAIQIHPLVCTAFNADFDGDQMAVHVPLSLAAQAEARVLMLAAYNLLSPANGKPLAAPQRDIIIGCYYLTLERKGDLGEGKFFSSSEEAIYAYQNKIISLFALIKVRMKGEMVKTTVGRLLFNQTIHRSLGDVSEPVPFYNKEMPRKELQTMVGEIYRHYGVTKTGALLDALKELGFTASTNAGLSVGIDDFKVPPEKYEILRQAEEQVAGVKDLYQQGLYSEDERYLQVVNIWLKATNQIEEKVLAHLERFDPVHMMAMSGARGDPKQVRQIVGMRGLMADPSGKIIEFPIKSSLRDGLTTLEYFISTHGARKGLADTAIKTADAGYLTRRLVDVAQEMVIREEDCSYATIRPIKKGQWVEKTVGTRAIGKQLAENVLDPKTAKTIAKQGDLIDKDLADKIDALQILQVTVRNKLDSVEIGDISEGKNVVEPMEERILGRTAVENIVNPKNKRIIVNAGEEINEDAVAKISAARDSGGNRLIPSIRVRSVLTCQAQNSVCAKCYGRDLAMRRPVVVGEAVGTIAAQSIGEPGTQLTLRTFHTGGIAEEDITTGLPRVEELFEARRPRGQASVSEAEGIVHIEDLAEDRALWVIVEEKPLLEKYREPNWLKEIPESDLLGFLLSLKSAFEMKEKNRTHPVTKAIDRYIEQYQTQHQTQINPQNWSQIEIIAFRGISATYRKDQVRRVLIGTSAFLRERGVSLPFDLIKEEALLLSIAVSGKYQAGFVIGPSRRYRLSFASRLRVSECDRIAAGDRLNEGPLNPSDILRLKGIKETQQYLLQEVQKVYKSQGVDINDKHIELIIRQLLRKVRINDAGDTSFLPGDLVNHSVFEEENRRVMILGMRPADAANTLLGMTKSALATDSFLSAASFQETTRVLTDAAVKGKIDGLVGLKENVIIGSLIPAGSGLPIYQDVVIRQEAENEVEETPPELDILQTQP